jgi:hypothetical protein
MNLDAKTLLDFVIGDFATSWDAVASTPDDRAPSRCNFMFGKQTMVLLELACRACSTDKTNAALTEFGAALNATDPRYFWRLPGTFKTVKGVELPTVAGVPANEHVLGGIFDLIRNGQAHQYQQIPALLADGVSFGVTLTGAVYGLTLVESGKPGRQGDHLFEEFDSSGNLWLKVRPDVLFRDLRGAVETARLTARGLTLDYFKRDSVFKTASSKDVKACLEAMRAKHPRA